MDTRSTIDPTFPSANALGYVDLVPLLAGTKRPLFKNWQNYNATTADLAEWQAAGYSLGHRSGVSKCGGQNIAALDADAGREVGGGHPRRDPRGHRPADVGSCSARRPGAESDVRV